MKSDETTKSAGYASVFGFNTRQLTRYLAGEVRPKIVKLEVSLLMIVKLLKTWPSSKGSSVSNVLL